MKKVRVRLNKKPKSKIDRCTNNGHFTVNNPSSLMIFLQIENMEEAVTKRPILGPIQTTMYCFYGSKDNPLNKLSNDL